jgi:hypothetical protein
VPLTERRASPTCTTCSTCGYRTTIQSPFAKLRRRPRRRYLRWWNSRDQTASHQVGLNSHREFDSVIGPGSVGQPIPPCKPSDTKFSRAVGIGSPRASEKNSSICRPTISASCAATRTLDVRRAHRVDSLQCLQNKGFDRFLRPGKSGVCGANQAGRASDIYFMQLRLGYCLLAPAQGANK